ncbi:MAG: protein-disulfide reductase DsbD domain-containing protein [Jannaschia sp.]
MMFESLRFLARATALALLAALLVLATGRLALAEAAWSDVSEVVSVEVISGWERADGARVAGLRFRLEPGWKTYWRSAGASGIAPRLDWQGSENVSGIDTLWPTPVVFPQGNALSIGYDRDFVLPLVVRPQIAGRDIVLSGQIDIGVCADICLPATLTVTATLNGDGDEDTTVRAALDDQPRAGVSTLSCATRPTPNGMALTAEIDMPALGETEVVVFEVSDPRLWVTDAIVHRSGDRLTATSELMLAGGGAVSVDRDDLRVTVIGPTEAVEFRGCGG